MEGPCCGPHAEQCPLLLLFRLAHVLPLMAPTGGDGCTRAADSSSSSIRSRAQVKTLPSWRAAIQAASQPHPLQSAISSTLTLSSPRHDKTRSITAQRGATALLKTNCGPVRCATWLAEKTSPKTEQRKTWQSCQACQLERAECPREGAHLRRKKLKTAPKGSPP